MRLLFISLAFYLFSSSNALAYSTEVGNVNNFGEFVSEVWQWGSQLIFGISVITIIIAGLVMMLAGGRESTVQKSKSMMSGAIIAALLIVFSAVIQKLLKKPTEDMGEDLHLSQTTEAVQNIVFILLGIVGGIAVLVLIFNGFQMIFSKGDVNKVEKAKRGFFYAIMGLIITFSAYIIIRYVIAPFST